MGAFVFTNTSAHLRLTGASHTLFFLILFYAKSKSALLQLGRVKFAQQFFHFKNKKMLVNI